MIKDKSFLILIWLARKGAITESLRVTTKHLAKELGMAQQSVSRTMIMMERSGLIDRNVEGRSLSIKLTKKGMEELRSAYLDLKGIFERPIRITVRGKVFTGLKEGAYYMSLPVYHNKLKELFGFDPYHGTLNLKLISQQDIDNRILLEKLAPLEVEEWHDEKRSYSKVKGIKATIKGDICGLIFIERTHYDKSVMEVISPYNLRERYGLNDGDLVEVEVQLQPVSFFENLLNDV